MELCLTLAETYHDLGLYKEIEGFARHSLQLARARLGEENQSVADSLIWLGDALHHVAQLHFGDLHPSNLEEADSRAHDSTLLEAEKCLRDGLAMTRKLLGNDNPKVARALYQLGDLLAVQSRLAEAETMHRQTLAMYRKLNGNEDLIVAKVLYELALYLAFQHTKLPEAETMNREALAIQHKLLGQDHPDIAKALYSLSLVLSAQGKQREAETISREMVAMWKKLQANDRIEMLSALKHLAQMLLVQGKTDEGVGMLREVLVMQRKMFGNEHPDVASSLFRLGLVLQQQGKLAEAEMAFREALGIRKKIFGNEHSDVTMSIDLLARVLQEQGKLAEAETLCREELASALALFKRSATNDFKRSDYAMSLAMCRRMLADVLAKAGQSDEAEQLMREGLHTYEQAARDFPTEPLIRNQEANTLFGLAATLRKSGRVDEAEAEYRAIIALSAGLKEAAANNPYEILATRELGGMLQGAGRDEAAAAEYRQLIALYEKADAISPNQIWIKSNLARLLREKGKLVGVKEINRAVAELYRKNPEGGDPFALNELARFLAVCSDSKLRDGPAAVAFAKRAVAATKPENPSYLDTLAAAYAEAGDFAEAVKIQQEALQRLGAADKAIVKRYASRLKLYESGSPYHHREVEKPN